MAPETPPVDPPAGELAGLNTPDMKSQRPDRASDSIAPDSTSTTCPSPKRLLLSADASGHLFFNTKQFASLSLSTIFGIAGAYWYTPILIISGLIFTFSVHRSGILKPLRWVWQSLILGALGLILVMVLPIAIHMARSSQIHFPEPASVVERTSPTIPCTEPKPFKQMSIGILIAPVPGDTPDCQLQKAYAQAIYEELNSDPSIRQLVQIELLSTPLKAGFGEQEQVDALRIGTMLHAAFVLRPHTVGSYQPQPILTIVNQPWFKSQEITLPGRAFPTIALATPSELTFPNDVALLAKCTVGIIDWLHGDLVQARTLIQQVLASNALPLGSPSRLDLTYVLGSADLFLGQYPSAAHRLASVVHANPTYHHAFIRLGLALEQEGDLKGALSAFRHASRYTPRDEDAYNEIGVVLVRQGNFTGAIHAFRKSIGIRPLPLTYANLANALSNLGDLTHAIIEARKGITLAPRISGPHDVFSELLTYKHAYSEALSEAHIASTLRPQDARAYLDAGNALMGLGKRSDAIKEYEHAYITDPKLAEAFNNVAVALIESEDGEQALSFLDRALDIAPKFVAARINLGNLFWMEHRPQAAIIEFKQALAFAPRNANAYIGLGSARHQSGDFTRAIAMERRAIALNRQSANAYINLATTLIDSGQSRSAIAYLKRAIQLDNHSYIAHYDLGIAIANTVRTTHISLSPKSSVILTPQQRKEITGAINEYRIALRCSNQYGASYINMGALLVILGKYRDAMTQFRAAEHFSDTLAIAEVDLKTTSAIKSGVPGAYNLSTMRTMDGVEIDLAGFGMSTPGSAHLLVYLEAPTEQRYD